MKRRTWDAKKNCRAALLFLFALAALVRPGLAAEPALLQTTAVYGVIATDPLYLWIAQDKGFFQKNGLKVDLTHIPTNQGVQALVGGKVNFVTAGPQILEANLAGSDTVYIMSPVNAFVFSLYSQPGIANIKALAGKTFGATNKGTPSDIAAHMLLTKNGLKPDMDVKFIYLKEIPALVAALQQGVIDAALLTPPATLTARNFGLKELLNVTELKIPFVQHGAGGGFLILADNCQGFDIAAQKTTGSFALVSHDSGGRKYSSKEKWNFKRGHIDEHFQTGGFGADRSGRRHDAGSGVAGAHRR